MNKTTNIKIAILLNEKSFLPEAFAYHKRLINSGFKVNLVRESNFNYRDFDVVIIFMGFFPFWKKYPKIVICDYNSNSTGNYIFFKNLIKRIFNVRGNITFFLSNYVKNKMFYYTNKKFSIRTMGFDIDYVNKFKNVKKEFDIVYAGSVRKGVLDYIFKFSNYGLKIALVGSNNTNFSNTNIISFGILDQEKTYEIVSKSRFGLNFTPDIEPYNKQVSTKVIEYCALGLGVISNKYQWINDFENENKGKFLNIDDINNKNDIFKFDFITPNISNLSWNVIFDKCDLENKILSLINNK